MRHLRILIYSNPLIVDKIAKKFLFWKDSGFIYTKQLVKSLPDNWRFYWCIPDKIKGDDLGWFEEANKNIELIPYPYSTSIHQNRYNFSVETLNKHFTYGFDIDAIFNMQPEVSANLRVWEENQRRERPIIFSFYHWIDCKESAKFGKSLSGYGIRQDDGAKASDYIMFHNEYAYNLFANEAIENITYNYWSGTPEKKRFFHPSSTIYNPVFFDTEIPDNKKIILFNHRLNNTTRWQEVVSILDEVYKERQDFVLWMTDDSNLKENEALKSREYIKVKTLTEGEYGYILNKAHFSICNHRGYSTWNMAVIDSFANNCLALIPGREVYLNMFANSIRRFGDCFVHNSNLKEMIIKTLNTNKNTNSSIAKQIVFEDSDIFVFEDNLQIQKLLEKDTLSYNQISPKKYQEVLEYIYNNEKTEKSEWVNKFWSFHVNSNFQIIRKKLLMEQGIRDDTSQSKTVYIRSLDGTI